LKKIKINLKLG